MLYLYDNAICDDLRKSFNPENVPDPVVKVVDPEHSVALAAQIQNGEKLSFPIVAVFRDADTSLDSERNNFTKAHRGVATVLDTETNELYYERSVPIKLSYTLTVVTTNTADMDEMIRELIFKYVSMYFLTIRSPYECKRKIRFGVSIDPDTEISRTSGSYEYSSEGKLYQSKIVLKCEGCVLLHYTPAKLLKAKHVVDARYPDQF